MRFLNCVMVLCMVVTVVGCTSFEKELKIESTLNPDGNYGNYHTYGWVEYNTDQIIIKDPQTRGRVVAAIEDALKAKGLKFEANSPDLLVGYHGAVDQKLDEERLGIYYDQSDMDLDSDAKFNKIDTWDVGTLVLMIFDAKNGMMLWQSSAQAELNDRASTSDKKKNIQTAVRLMLETLPTSKDIDKARKENK